MAYNRRNETIYDNPGIDTDIDIEQKTVKNILYARKTDGLYSSIITGPRGAGKTSYSLQILFNIFRTLGYDVETSWNMSLERVLFKVPEIIRFLEHASEQKNRDICIWDDAGVYAGGVRWLTNQQEMVLIESICDTLRDSVYCILFTVPNVRTLSRRIRSYDDNIVSIKFLNERKKEQLVKKCPEVEDDLYNIREARVMRKTILPSGMVRIYKNYSDNFNILLPNWVYKKYKEKRHSYTRENIIELKKHLNKEKD